MGLAPVDDVVIVVVGGDGAAHDQKQPLRQRVGDAPSLAWVRHGAEVVQQAASVRVGEHVHLGFPIRRENPSQAHNRYLLIAVTLTSLPCVLTSAGYAQSLGRGASLDSVLQPYLTRYDLPA